MSISPDRDEIPWTELLVCPRCRGDLVEYVADASETETSTQGLLCVYCRLLYLITNGVPVMDEALAKTV